MQAFLKNPEYLIFSIGAVAVLGLSQWIFSRGGKPDRIRTGDWLLLFLGLISGGFCIEKAVKLQRELVLDLVQKLNPAHAHLIDDLARGKLVLSPLLTDAAPWPGLIPGAIPEGNFLSLYEAAVDRPLAAPGFGFDQGNRGAAGPWPSGFFATYDSQGQVKAVLDIDYINQRRLQSVEAMRRLATGTIASVFLAIGGIILYFRRRQEHIESQVESARVLAQSEARFRHLFEGSPDAIFVCDCQGKIADVNPRVSELLGIGKEDLHGRKFTEFLDCESGAQMGDELENLASGSIDRLDRISLRGGDEQSIPVEACSRGIRFQDAGGILLHVRDISERLKLEHELLQAQKMQGIGQLAAGVAHDFNNLLTVIQGHTVMLKEHELSASDTMDSLKEIDAATERAAELTRHLLTFSRKQQMRPQHLDANCVINDIVKLLSRLIPEHIELRVRTEAPGPVVRADRGMLEQVVTNLVINAHDAMPHGGRLEVVTQSVRLDESEVRDNPQASAGNYLLLMVRDTGVGMDGATRSRIFEPFFTTKDVGKGTGLGLASVYGIVAQHGGWIEVDSVPGEGSAFKIYFPESQEQATDSKSSESVSDNVEGGTETILVVEDEPSLRELAALTMERFGYRVIQASSGLEALRLWDEIADQVDIVLTDMVMPEGVSGLELGKRLRAMNRSLPIVHMSGYSGNIIGLDGEGHSDFPILQKPYTPKALAQTIRATLDRAGGQAYAA